MYMYRSSKGYVLIAVLMLLQVTLAIGIAGLTSSSIAVRSAHDHWQRNIALQPHPANMVSRKKSVKD